MATLFVFDEAKNDFDALSEEQFLCRGLTVREFLARSYSDIGWTDLRLAEAFSALCDEYGPIYAGVGFRRLKSGIHRGQSSHYAGLALDIGQGLPSQMQAELRGFCIKSELFSYVQPDYRTPSWVHVEVKSASQDSYFPGYPFLELGDWGVHVFLLQDALTLCGFSCPLTGHFTHATRKALLGFQSMEELTSKGYADATTWQRLIGCTKKAAPPPFLTFPSTSIESFPE